MKNLLLYSAPTFIMLIIVVGIIIYTVVKKTKYWIITTLLLLFLTIGVFVYTMPEIKDIIYRETVVVVGEYTKYWTHGAQLKVKIFLKTDDETVELEAPRVTKMVANMKEGERYRITYYKNSKVIKDYVLIE